MSYTGKTPWQVCKPDKTSKMTKEKQTLLVGLNETDRKWEEKFCKGKRAQSSQRIDGTTFIQMATENNQNPSPNTSVG